VFALLSAPAFRIRAALCNPPLPGDTNRFDGDGVENGFSGMGIGASRMEYSGGAMLRMIETIGVRERVTRTQSGETSMRGCAMSTRGCVMSALGLEIGARREEMSS